MSPSDQRITRLARKRGPISIDELYRVREEVKAVDDRVVDLVALADICPSPYNPRRALDGIAELGASVAEHGLLQTSVALPERRDPEQKESMRRLHSLLERARTYYQGLLWGTSGAAARAYLLDSRGLDENAARFGRRPGARRRRPAALPSERRLLRSRADGRRRRRLGRRRAAVRLLA